MRTRPIRAALVLWLLPSMAFAQDGLRSASLPERTVEEPSARDVFRVPPDFYNRPPDPGPPRLFFPQPLPTIVVPGWYVDPYRVPRVPADRHHGTPPPRAEAAPGTSLQTAPPVLVAAPPPPSLPGKPKPFYVIPSCYAGDKPPRPGSLPAGCDVSRMRIVPPQ